MQIKTSIGTYPNLEELVYALGAPGVSRARAVVVGHVIHLGFSRLLLGRDEFADLTIPGSYASAIRVARLLSDSVKVLPTLAE